MSQPHDSYGRAPGGGVPHDRSGAAPNPHASPKAGGGTAWVRSRSPALRIVANGLSLVLIGLALSLLSMLAGFAVGSFFVSLLSVGSRICTVVGQLMCLMVPRETGAKPLILAAVALMMIGAFIAGVMPLWDSESSSTLLLWLAALSALLPLASFVCFVLFLRNLAEYVGRRDVTEDCQVLLLLIAAMIGVVILMFSLSLALMSIWVVWLSDLALLVLYVLFLLKYINVLGTLRGTLLGQ